MITNYKKVNRKKVRNFKKKARVIAYAKVVSGTPLDKEGVRVYSVVRYKDRKFGCNCPSRLFRRNVHCKHIKAFKDYEKSLKILGAQREG